MKYFYDQNSLQTSQISH